VEKCISNRIGARGPVPVPLYKDNLCPDLDALLIMSLQIIGWINAWEIFNFLLFL